MRKRYFKHIGEAEDFANDMVFGGDDPDVEAELVEVWPDEASYTEAALTDAWGALYVIWGTEAEVDQGLELLGDWISAKGRVARQGLDG
jgi:hypothetical protein